jgi:hypothetical protein
MDKCYITKKNDKSKANEMPNMVRSREVINDVEAKTCRKT